MEFVHNYIPELCSYQSMRHVNYDYSWSKETSKKDSRKQSETKKNKDQCTPSKNGGRDSCPICQERQRRPLSTYIRSKSREDRKKDTSIQEEAEEDESQVTQTGQLAQKE